MPTLLTLRFTLIAPIHPRHEQRVLQKWNYYEIINKGAVRINVMLPFVKE